MVNHYTVSKKRRHKDSYTSGGEGFKRPDRAVIVYSQMARQAFPDANILIGGIEASLRRLAHYDYWSDKVRKSIIIDANADLLMFGMGENSIVEVAEALDSGLDIKYLTYLDGTVYKTKNIDDLNEADYIMLPSYEEITTSKRKYAESFQKQYLNTDHYNAKILVEPYQGWYVVQNFCALAFHQGRIIQARSHESIIAEANKMVWDPNFKGYIHDVGGPTANFRDTACDKQKTKGACPTKQCLWPEPCKNLKVDHEDYLSLLTKLRQLPNVKKVFVRSGIRYDYLMYDKNDHFFEELVQHHISGQLKVAPEHISNHALDKMGKPRRGLYEKFVDKYYRINEKYNKKQFLVPYLMSSHPGCRLEDAIELAEYLRDIHHQPEQVQDFYPTPGTLSTTMYYTGLDPRDMTPVYVPKDPKEKAMQRALIQYKNPKNYDLVYEALIKANRKDLIGFGKKCLIKPRTKRQNYNRSYTRGHK